MTDTITDRQQMFFVYEIIGPGGFIFFLFPYGD